MRPPLRPQMGVTASVMISAIFIVNQCCCAVFSGEVGLTWEFHQQCDYGAEQASDYGTSGHYDGFCHA